MPPPPAFEMPRKRQGSLSDMALASINQIRTLSPTRSPGARACLALLLGSPLPVVVSPSSPQPLSVIFVSWQSLSIVDGCCGCCPCCLLEESSCVPLPIFVSAWLLGHLSSTKETPVLPCFAIAVVLSCLGRCRVASPRVEAPHG